jgi:undecaprenyl-diphosphatase
MGLGEIIHQWDLSLLFALHSLTSYRLFDAACHLMNSSSLLRATVPTAVYWYFWFDDSGRNADRREVRRVVLAGLIGSMIAVGMARLLADFLPFRLRPFYDPGSGFPLLRDPANGDFENWSAFPSDTAAFVFALSFGLYPLSRRLSYGFAIYSAVVVCMPRIYFGIHYPSDIIAGAAVGTIGAWLSQKFIRGGPIDVILGFSERHRAWFFSIAFIVAGELGIMFRNVRDAGRIIIGELRELPVGPLPYPAGFVAGVLLLAAACVWVVLRYKSRFELNGRPKSLEKY